LGHKGYAATEVRVRQRPPDHQHLPVAYNLGLLRWRRGEITDTDLVARLDAILAGSDGWLARYLLAQVHLERGDVTAARERLDAARRQAPEVPELREAAAACGR
jgi:tetratricopeptide repeat protein